MARKRVEYVQKLLERIGLEGQRIQMINLSSAMASQFAEMATDFTERVRELGPSPLGWRPEEEGERSGAGESMSRAHEGKAHESDAYED